MPVTRQGMTIDAIEELIAQRVADALATYETNRNIRNGNGNGSGSQSDGGSGSRRTVHTARGCTYKEFLNCQPLNFKVKYATCTLLNSALTWWNSYVRTAGHDAAYEMSWMDLIKMMIKANCLRNEIHKLESKLMVLGEEDKVERYVWGLPDSIQGNVTFAVPCTNCKKVGHLARDCRVTTAVVDERAHVANQRTLTCFEYGNQGHYRSECPELKNQNRRNQTGNGEARGRVKDDAMLRVVIIEQLVKVREKNVFWSINEEVQQSLLNLTSILARMEGITIDEYLTIKDKKMAKRSMNSSFEKLWYLADEDDEEETYVEYKVFDLPKIDVDLFTCDTPLKAIFDEFSRLSSKEDDLFAYEVGVLEDSYFPCVEQPYDDLENVNLDIYELRQCYDKNERIFTEAVILINNKLNALWLYWIRGDDEEVLTDDEFSDLEEENLREGLNTYEDYKNIWYYEWNNEVPWVDKKPWLEDGIWREPIDDICHECKPFRFKSRHVEWPTYNWREDRYCNRGDLPRMIRVGK
ncbi:reverse transcriptase domain-containing protein [Tanacetum coccineum]|uniref:Reverse transcriptase domain-containing protein n=1 Tax=Tanacetum coccineum TaxID=301880 RepID=A0ABQ5IHM8_9ASTR